MAGGPSARRPGWASSGASFVRQPLRLGPDGEWLLPGFRCITPPEGRWTGGLDTAVLLISRDRGQSWQAQEVPDSPGAVHMNPVAGGAGPMPAFYRDRFAQTVRRSLSADGGLSWSAPAPTELPNNNSSIQAARLADGRIAMVLNPVNAATSDQRRASLYDEIEGEEEEVPQAAPQGTGGAIWGVPRAPMSLMISAGQWRYLPGPPRSGDGRRLLPVEQLEGRGEP